MPTPPLPLGFASHPQANGRCWAQLVQGSRCGSLIPKDDPLESAESLCRNHAVRCAAEQQNWPASCTGCMLEWRAVGCTAGAPRCAHHRAAPAATRRLALAQPRWEPKLHALWPQRFRDAASLLLLASQAAGGSGAPALPLSHDALFEVLAAAAYPISAWL